MIEAKLQNLFGRTRDLIDHHRQMEIQKGEKFNVFSILQVESKENLTHSNFIAELLDPKGSHLKGSCFLELFLESVSLKLDDFDFQNCRVRKEHPTGNIDWEEETGGRLDLLISDANQDVLIENKVYAGDQKLQLLRYHNSKVRKGSILYLTLDGREPSDYSRGNLVSGVDYHPISYKVEINNWLEKCQKEAYNAPIVRETIRQYQLLIQKLTGTMQENEREKLQALIMDNLDEAKLIAQNYTSAKASVAHSFRADLIEHLKKGLQNSFQIDIGSPTDKPTSQIWIKPDVELPEGFYFGIESFSVTNRNHHEGKLYIGSFCNGKDKTIRAKYTNDFNWFSDWWFDTSVFTDFENTTLDFSQNDFVKKITQDSSFRSRLLDYLTEDARIYLKNQIEKIMKVVEP
jgi:hypothetical protein